MNKKCQKTLIFLLFLLFPASLCMAEPNAPSEIAGIKLGSSINDYQNIVQTNFMKDVVVTDWYGFRKGVISYGICKYQNQILKIDMKYYDKTEDFYKKLLKKFRKRFGKPESFEGDSFGLIRVWKWRFRDKDTNAINLSLQHNKKNTSETIGNMVKLTMPERIVEERRCFMEMCDEMNSQRKQQHTKPSSSKPDWDNLIPR